MRSIPGLVIFSGRLKNGVDIRKAEEAVTEELDRLASGPVTAAELEKARNRYESHRLMSYLSAVEQSFQSCISMSFSVTLTGINTETDGVYECHRRGDQRQLHARVFSPDNCSVIHYLPEMK
ncbi:MAG: insulinase family protein [Marinilabiliales bacterium]|nr:insulinase family protein [Marinilabiliales bacterium]